MDKLTAEDRGTFIVTTYSGTTHTWEISDEAVMVTRKASGPGHWSMQDFTTRPYRATVQTWPVVGGRFHNIVNGGAGDVPWTLSSTIVSIERVG